MKTIFTLLFVALVSVTTAQNTTKSLTSNAKSVMVYSEEEEALIYKSESDSHGSEILIASLPEFGTEAIPVLMYPGEKGSYTFKKHPSLLIPEFYNVVIKDSVTGEQFDLKNADSYSFVVTKDVPERFMLQMSKVKTDLTAMR